MFAEVSRLVMPSKKIEYEYAPIRRAKVNIQRLYREDAGSK
jgi:hypothetical protein